MKTDKEKLQIGWICPACGNGNAPMALKCYHCPKIRYELKTDSISKNLKI